MRYVLIRDDASLEDIDEGLAALRSKRLATVLPIIRSWITEDINELLDMRTARVMADAVGSQPTH